MKDNYEPSGYAPGYFQMKWHTQCLGFIKLQCFKNKMCSNHISKTCQVKVGLTKWHSATAPCEKKSSCFQTTLFSTLKKIESSIHQNRRKFTSILIAFAFIFKMWKMSWYLFPFKSFVVHLDFQFLFWLN